MADFTDCEERDKGTKQRKKVSRVNIEVIFDGLAFGIGVFDEAAEFAEAAG